MIAIDFNNLIISNLIRNEEVILNENVIRDVCLHFLKGVIKKFKLRFFMNCGVIVVDDDRHSWRRSFFSNYKYNRFITSDININWHEFYEKLTKIKAEISENLPIRYIKVKNCEADDIISVIAGKVINVLKEDVLIVSSDKDFYQLHCPFVHQYSPSKRRMVSFQVSPTFDMYKKIFFGDISDGIPNYISSDEALVENSSIKLNYKRVNYLLENIPIVEGLLFDYEKPGFYRNKKLIDLYEIPKELQDDILEEFKVVMSKEPPSLLKTAKYLKENNLNYLLSRIGDY